MRLNYTTLAEALAEIPDPRSARGQSFEWLFLLLVIAAALMSGKSALIDIDDWVQAHGDEMKAMLKPKKERAPSLCTLRRVLCDVSITKPEAALSKFQVGLIGETGGAGTIVTINGVWQRSCSHATIWVTP